MTNTLQVKKQLCMGVCAEQEMNDLPLYIALIIPLYFCYVTLDLGTLLYVQ